VYGPIPGTPRSSLACRGSSPAHFAATSCADAWDAGTNALSIGSFPGPLVSAAFQLTAVDRLVTKPLTLASRLDDRDFLAQIEAVDHLLDNMRGYPGRMFGQIYHLMLRNNDLADGTLALRGQDIALAAVDVPVLVVAGRDDVIAPLAAVER
jgi:polyhydroxyalkanoate synthase